MSFWYNKWFDGMPPLDIQSIHFRTSYIPLTSIHDFSTPSLLFHDATFLELSILKAFLLTHSFTQANSKIYKTLILNNLVKKGCNDLPKATCEFFQMAIKTTNHLFLQCSFVAQIWNHFSTFSCSQVPQLQLLIYGPLGVPTLNLAPKIFGFPYPSCVLEHLVGKK